MKEAGRPLPKFSEDEVTDYFVTEAIVVKAGEARKKEEKSAERERWRKSHRDLAKGKG